MKKSFFQSQWGKALQLQNFLTRHQYFSKDCLPGISDALMFQIFDTECNCDLNTVPDRTKYPNLYYWYINVKQFSRQAINNWSLRSDKDLYFLQILNRYQHKDQSSEDQIKETKSDSDENQHYDFENITTPVNYILKIKFKKISQRQLTKFHKNILSKAEIISFQMLGDTLRVRLKCDALKIQLIKSEASIYRNIKTYQVEKEKHKRLARALTFNRN